MSKTMSVYLVWPDGTWLDKEDMDERDFQGRSDDFNYVHVPQGMDDVAVEWFEAYMPEPCPEGVVVR